MKLFKILGPDHMGLILSPYNNVKLLRWSIDPNTPLKGNKFGNRDTYFVYFSYTNPSVAWNFFLDFEVMKFSLAI